MKKNFSIVVCCMALFVFQSCQQNQTLDPEKEKAAIHSLLDSFNIAAAKADYNKYFGYYAEDAVFTGTDATERWTKDSFMRWAKPFFDRGRAWAFTTVKRDVYLNQSGDIAWFDELLDTQMKLCRGSGVLGKEGNSWKIKQYILSTMVPNTILDSVIILKAKEEDSVLHVLKK